MVVPLFCSGVPYVVQVRAQLEREVAAAAGELVAVHEATRVATEAKQEAQAQVGGQPRIRTRACVDREVRKCGSGARSVVSCPSVCCRPSRHAQ